jgi:adenosylmethionine-8-amino-7-oxononanoate aminotransferase
VTSSDIRALAQRHLLGHFTRGEAWRRPDLPVIVRGEGCHVVDDAGRRYLDGLSGLFCVNVGHGRADIAAAATTQMESLAYSPTWSAAHPAAAEAAAAVAALAPGDLDVVFFVSSGSEAAESALKFVRQYHRSQGHPERTTVIARDMSYHGTTMGALSLTGIERFRAPFAPLLPGIRHVPNTLGEQVPDGGSAADLPSLRALVATIEQEGPETVAAVFAEPVQNSRGCLVPPTGYWQELRAICDRYDILLVADEVICGFGRLGEWFGSSRYDVVPDLITFAKGATSGYAPIGGVVIRTGLVEQLMDAADAGIFTHGATWGGHPVATAVTSANLAALDDVDALGNVRRLEPAFQAALDQLAAAHTCVREWSGTGFFYAIELMADRDSGRELTPAQSTALIRTVMPQAMRAAGLITRPDDRGATMLVLAPPLVADRPVLDELAACVDTVLDAVDAHTRSPA